jgi:hypothetical protein
VRRSSGGETTVVGSAEEIWTVGFYVQGGAGKRTEEEIVSHRISLRYSSAVGSGEDAQSLVSGVCTKEEEMI